MTRISEKIDEIKDYLDELEDIIPDKFKDYNSNKLVKAACERYFERIIEGVIDISFMIIAEKRFEIPEDDIDSFRILQDHKIIGKKLCKKLKEAKGMRNFIAHQYGRIDDKLVFKSIRKELVKDVGWFIRVVKKRL
ncbi:hypothetical protein COT48_01720 [Candidatus Woesearchaeota archaeon CG08_land_8_20_14_0_20_47_9]|nr:MAG: hypothetical protein AUJ69_02605 [Candidatus Woesearchaeota archaeon CG1_02_47_18]PIO04194.1 MAG: hypothetical protein COT48_01720 [Candidatus Woesearchaeota archaeon CG08_land_8_20_14_0_20_47_9]HII29869.1 DUF86 domain-containing protein [Candidatus Woesearchaeota archaeon]